MAIQTAREADDFEELLGRLRSSHSSVKLELARLKSQVGAFHGEALRAHPQAAGPSEVPTTSSQEHEVPAFVQPNAADTHGEMLLEPKAAWASADHVELNRQVSRSSSKESANQLSRDNSRSGSKESPGRPRRNSCASSKSKTALQNGITAILPGNGDLQLIPSSVSKERTGIQYSSLPNLCEYLMQHPWFEATFAFLIFLNCFTMSLESQKRGLLIGAQLSEEGGSDTSLPPALAGDAASIWPGAESAFEACNMFFGIVFLFEILIKILGYRLRFVCYVWNIIDFSLVTIWIVSLAGNALAVHTNMLRVARLARVLRLLRLAKTIQGFDALYLISTSLKSSVSILAWAVVMFFVMQVAVALFLTNILADSYLEDQNSPHAEREAVYIYFGTVTRATFSMFELTLANWPPVARLLAENVSEWYMFFGVLHKLTIGFAFVGVVNGVFMQETFNVASTDDRIMVTHKERMEKTHLKKMRMFFRQADRSGDGVIDAAEFRDMISNEAVAVWLAAQGLEGTDSILFPLLDHDGDGMITLEELVRGVSKLKGFSRSVDQVRVLYELESIREGIESHINSSHGHLS